MSQLTRRSFFERMFGAALAVPILGRSLLASTPVAIEPHAPLPELWTLTVVREAFAIFQREMASYGTPIDATLVYPNLSRLGEYTPRGAFLDHQNQIELNNLQTVDIAMRALAKQCADDGIGYWGVLSIANLAGCDAATFGPLRFIRQYDVQTDSHRMRFDVIGASTQAFRETARKRRIKARLAKPRTPRRLPA